MVRCVQYCVERQQNNLNHSEQETGNHKISLQSLEAVPDLPASCSNDDSSRHCTYTCAGVVIRTPRLCVEYHVAFAIAAPDSRTVAEPEQGIRPSAQQQACAQLQKSASLLLTSSFCEGNASPRNVTI